VEFPWRVKLRRADVHLGAFSQACADYIRTSHVGFAYVRDPETGSLKVKLQADTEPPMLLGAIVGDILHNLRSALDSIAWEACQCSGVAPGREKDVYFPIGSDPVGWPSQAKGKLPGVEGPRLEVFRQLQPWIGDEAIRAAGREVTASTATWHPLFRLNQMARLDRHRITNPVLARAGDTWLGTPDGVTASALPVNYWLARPGDVVLEWRITPPGAVLDVNPDGEAILAFSEEAASHRRSAHSELKAMRQAVAHAMQRVEIEVLEVVTPAEMSQLEESHDRLREAEAALYSLTAESHVIDAAYIDKHKKLTAAAVEARRRYEERWHELFE
jgi:hypothetical protein